MIRVLHIVVLSLVGCYVLSLAGCYSSGNASIRSQELIEQVKPGISTKDDVRDLFGEPNGITKTSTKVVSPTNSSKMITLVEWWSYVHVSSRTDAKSFIPFAGVFLGGSTYESDTFQVGFDSKGVVQSLSSNSSHGKSGMMNSQ